MQLAATNSLLDRDWGRAPQAILHKADTKEDSPDGAPTIAALDLAGIAHDAVVSRFSRPALSVGEADDFKIERQLIFVRSAERIGIDRSSAAREQRLLLRDATLTREGCKRIRQAVRQER